jgi:hypothetical protein
MKMTARWGGLGWCGMVLGLCAGTASAQEVQRRLTDAQKAQFESYREESSKRSREKDVR